MDPDAPRGLKEEPLRGPYPEDHRGVPPGSWMAALLVLIVLLGVAAIVVF
jgi:hypothetical protein